MFKRLGRISIFLSFLGLVHCGQGLEAKKLTTSSGANSETSLFNGGGPVEENNLAIHLLVSEKCDASEMACEVVEKINQIRVSNSLGPLKIYKACENAAQSHAQDMALNQYFDHIGLNGSTPMQRLKNYGPMGRGIAENIGMANTDTDIVVQAWMDSPSHRANILDPDLTHTGVGVAISAGNQSGYGSDVYFVQCFLAN